MLFEYALYVIGCLSCKSLDDWEKHKEKAPDVSDPNQNAEATCKSKLKVRELKDLLIKRVQRN